MPKLAVVIARCIPTPLKQLIHRHRGLDNVLRKGYGALSQFGGSRAVIPAGPMTGIKLRLGEHISHAHLSGSYELETQEAFARLLRPGWVCYDVGASIGYLTLLMARTARKVYAFEPAPHAIETMRGLLEENGFQNVEIIPNPVSDSKVQVRFALTDVAYGSGIARGDTSWPTIEVPTMVLDDFVASGHPAPDFLKIDIEGEECRALRGAKSILDKGTTIICCEVHSPELAREACGIFASHGYTVTTLGGQPFHPEENVKPGEVQVIALPKNRPQGSQF